MPSISSYYVNGWTSYPETGRARMAFDTDLNSCPRRRVSVCTVTQALYYMIACIGFQRASIKITIFVATMGGK